MYHYTNPPIYNHDVYQHCSMLEITKNHNESASVVGPNESNVNHQNVAFIALDVDNNVLAQHRGNKSEKKTEIMRMKSVVDTSSFSIEERLVTAVWVHERRRTNVGMSQIKRDFRERFGRDPPAKNTLLRWEKKLFATGSVHDAPRQGRPVNRLSRLDDVLASMNAAPTLSLRARARSLRLPPSTLRLMLRRDLPKPATEPTMGKPSSQVKSKLQTRKKGMKVIPGAPVAAPM